MSEVRKLAFNKRCYISHRPPFRTEEPVFFRCPHCGALTIHHGVSDQIPGNGRTSNPKVPRIICCDAEVHPLPILEGDQIPEGHEMEFTVFGGFENNSVHVTIDGGNHPMRGEHRIEWIYYRTFQGGQLKYLPEKGRSVCVFSFADEDSFVYCDRDVCRMGHEHCQFCCKRGNEIYAYCSVHGLIKLYMNGF